MIIVSQDKETIVNFNNISIITQVDGRIGVTNNATNSTVSEIGVYKTEERAKKVLQEIITSYADFNYLKSFPANITKSVEQFMHKKYSYFNVYEMPEE